MLEVLAREHTPRVDVAVIAMSANVVELVTCEDDGSIVTSTDVREDGRHRQTFADVQSAVEAVWCKPPVESHLCLPHVPAVANIPAVAELRQIIEALMDSQTLDAATKAEMCAHLDPLTLQRFVFARPTVDSAASMFTTSMAPPMPLRAINGDQSQEPSRRCNISRRASDLNTEQASCRGQQHQWQ